MIMADDQSKKGPAQTVEDRPQAAPAADSADKTVIRSQGEIEEEMTPSRQQTSLPYMVVVDGPRIGTRFPLKEGANIMGRAPTNEIRLEDQSVSRQHAEVMRQPKGYVVKDLGSKNGTLVNGKQISEAVKISHKDVVKTGIYQLRLVTQKMALDEELTLPPELAMSDRTVFVAIPPDSLTSRMEEREVPREGSPAEEIEEVQGGEEKPLSAEEKASGSKAKMVSNRFSGLLGAALADKRKATMFGVLIVLLIITAGYFGKSLLFKPAKRIVVAKSLPADVAPRPAPTPAPAPAPMPAPTVPETAPAPTPVPSPEVGPLPAEAPPVAVGPTPPAAGAPGTAAPAPAPAPAQPGMPVEPAVSAIPVFVDFASSPLPAKVMFKGQDVGQTPMRINVQLMPGQSYEAEATFVMPEINESYTQKVSFQVELGQSVVPVLFRAPIGIFKVMGLPKDTELYMEGKFVYDKYRSGTAKPDSVVFNKPSYVPYGTYVVELRRARKLGDTSSTYVSDIIYRRDFVLAEDQPTYVLEVNEEDLKIFPVKVKSDPSNAEVFIDGKLAGTTPYEGTFPLGEHRLVLRKEGFFEHAEDLKVDINTPFLADVKLQTSIAGAHINNAKLAMNRQMYQEAINELAAALTSEPAPSEIALANYMLGKSYYALNDIQRAISYFEQARQVEEQRYPAMLGLVACYAAQQQTAKALPLLVEVMLKSKDEEVKREANGLFQKISPLRSVIYVYSDPSGATVTVNDKPVAQQTPVILHDLPLGSYRIRIEKAGYLPTDLSLSMSVNEFNPVIVKLKPIPQ